MFCTDFVFRVVPDYSSLFWKIRNIELKWNESIEISILKITHTVFIFEIYFIYLKKSPVYPNIIILKVISLVN